VTGTAQQTRLRIGDPDRAVSGRHRYRLAYPLAGVASGGRATQAAFADPDATVQRIDAADLARLATVEFTPPRELTPAQGGVLLTETVLPSTRWTG
jgi:hypothetical protein